MAVDDEGIHTRSPRIAQENVELLSDLDGVPLIRNLACS